MAGVGLCLCRWKGRWGVLFLMKSRAGWLAVRFIRRQGAPSPLVSHAGTHGLAHSPTAGQALGASIQEGIRALHACAAEPPAALDSQEVPVAAAESLAMIRRACLEKEGSLAKVPGLAGDSWTAVVRRLVETLRESPVDSVRGADDDPQLLGDLIVVLRRPGACTA